MDKTQQNPNPDAGFTLMELLVVLVIVGLLAAFVGPTLYQRISPAKSTVARSQIESFATALDNFLIDNGRYPTTEQGLTALRRDPGLPQWSGRGIDIEALNISDRRA